MHIYNYGTSMYYKPTFWTYGKMIRKFTRVIKKIWPSNGVQIVEYGTLNMMKWANGKNKEPRRLCFILSKRFSIYIYIYIEFKFVM